MFRFPLPLRLAAWLAALLLGLAGAPAAAAVEITFYSKELGDSFPHTFVTLSGTPDRGGPRIEEDFGFTAKAVTPALLFGRVGGKVISDHSERYVKASDPHFTLALTDQEFDAVIAAVERWRAHKQPSYDLGKRNCVHFVAELAAAAGLDPQVRKGLMKKPRSFLEQLTLLNVERLRARGAVIHQLPETK